ITKTNMKRSIFLIITAVLSLLIGIMCLLSPDKMADGFGVAVTPLIIMLIREAGVSNLCMGFLNFAVRNHSDSMSLKAVLFFNMAYHALILPINIYGWSQGILSVDQVGPAFGIHLLLAIGFLLYALKIKTSA
ncbi:MAG TPA: hypothetical protein VFW11_22785, partial [Cyclobacteriaceae bacterium]|nr:hypothetical protein [Cyclobacteriaceae bacterium]